jgi:hypothetical protein
MASPPPSSELEYDLSSGDAADEIPLLIADARRTKDLTPAVATVMLTHKHLILSVFDRQIQLIKSRSQALEDGHVTVYDKALLTLSSNGSDLENPSALLFWCEHYLGIDRVRAAADTPKFMQEMMAVPTVLNQGKRNPRSFILTRCSSSGSNRSVYLTSSLRHNHQERAR